MDQLNIQPQDTTKTEMQSVTPGGKAPRRRIASPEAAYIIYKRFKDDDALAAQGRAVVQGMNDGNPPYEQSTMDELGLSDTTNVNFLSMRAGLDARAASAHELFVEVPTLAEFFLRSTKDSTPDEHDYCCVMAEEFTQMMLDWPKFNPTMDLVVRESDLFGIGFALWPDEFDWRPKAFRRGTLRFDAMASVYIDENDVYTINDKYTAGELYDIIESEYAEKRGWKVGNVKDLLVKTFIVGEGTKEEKYQVSPWESLQQMRRNNDVAYQEKQFAKIKVVHVLVREVAVPRKVTHLILAEDDSKQVFLCEATDRFNDMHEVIWWLPQNYGDGYARSVRGVASFMVQHDDLTNRFLCRVFDAGFLSSSMILQPQTQGDLSRLQFVHQGPYTILPAELQAVQSSFAPNIAPLLSLHQVSQNVLQNNVGGYRPNNESLEREAEKTARQVVEETAKEARYEKAAVAHRYDQLDILYREIMRRITREEYFDSDASYGGKELAKDFIRRCTERGVPRKFIIDWKKNTVLHATRAIGMGSLGMRYDLTSQMVNPMVLANMDERGRITAWRDWGAARVGYRKVDQYFAKASRDNIPSQETIIAGLENHDLQEGVECLVSPDQTHKLHLDVHLPIVAQIVQAVSAGQITDPTKAAQALQLTMQHSAQHIQYLSRDESRNGYLKQVEDLMKAGRKALAQLGAAIKRMQAQQAAQQQAQQETVQKAQQVLADREFESKVMEIQQKSQLAQIEQQSLNDMRQSKTDNQNQISRGKAEQQAQLAAEKQAETLRQKALTAEADRQIKASKG